MKKNAFVIVMGLIMALSEVALCPHLPCLA